MSETVNAGGGRWPALDVNERRVLGVLVEKAKTTPDAYPMSVNALVTGSNQKSNRDPILELDEDDVLDALNAAKGRGLVTKVIGSRTEKWKHELYEQWRLDKVEIAIVAELLLRGPQTEGELRTRASRMEDIDDLDTLKLKLRPLIDRGLVVYLTAEDRRGAVLTHGFHAPGELERLKRQAASGAPAAAVTASASAHAAPAPRDEGRLAALAEEVAEVRHELAGTFALLQKANERVEAVERLAAQLAEALDATRQELQALRQSLGG